MLILWYINLFSATVKNIKVLWNEEVMYHTDELVYCYFLRETFKRVIFSSIYKTNNYYCSIITLYNVLKVHLSLRTIFLDTNLRLCQLMIDNILLQFVGWSVNVFCLLKVYIRIWKLIRWWFILKARHSNSREL